LAFVMTQGPFYRAQAPRPTLYAATRKVRLLVNDLPVDAFD
jgi:hypothetical protein